MKTEIQTAIAVAEFAERWKGRGYERGESQPFWIDLLHQADDRAVMAAYGFPVKTMTDSQCVAELFKLYQELTRQ